MQKKFFFLPQTIEVYKFLPPECLEGKDLRAIALLIQSEVQGRITLPKALHCIYLQNNFIGKEIVRAFRHTVTEVRVIEAKVTSRP